MHARDDFAGRLLAELHTKAGNRNILLSPTSVLLALSMAWNGARGQTRESMAAALGFAGLEAAEVNRLNAGMITSLATADPEVELVITNALWVRAGIPLADDFVRTCENYYQGRAEELDFDSEAAVTTVNDWVRNRTRNRIPTIIDQLGREDVLLLTNAVYFNGRWMETFDPEKTRERQFRTEAGPPRLTPMMERAGRFDYREEAGLQVARLPYGRGDFALYVLLPEEIGTDRLVAALATNGIESIIAAVAPRDGTLVLPRFRVEFDGNLNDALSGLGMDIAFDPRRADFQAMLPAEVDMAFFVSEVVHKSFIEVGEAGTEAAAATGVRMSMTAMPGGEDRFVMACDRPFVFIVREEATGTTLFIGIVNDPTT